MFFLFSQVQGSGFTSTLFIVLCPASNETLLSLFCAQNDVLQSLASPS